MLTKYNLKMPHAVYGGENAMDNIAAIIGNLNAKKVAMFTDKGLRGLGLFTLAEDVVKATGVEYYVLDDLPPEPSYMAVQKIVDEFKQSGADLIVACGGGSVMDAAKLASILVTDEYGVKELLDNPGVARKCVPIVLIPTTAGTGAEVTPNAIVGVPEKELKIGIVNENMIADYVILDARLIKNLPRKIAAATGVDALAHCIECFTSNKANPFSDMYALEGADLILNNIEKACDDSSAMTEKNRMQMAAYYGGLAQDFVDVSPLNQDTVAPGTAEAIEAVKAKIVSGEWDVFSGVKLHVTVNTDGTVSVDQADEALVDNAGSEIVAAGGPSVEDSVITGSMNYFVAGVEEA